MATTSRIIPGMRVVACWGEMQILAETPGSYVPDGVDDLMSQVIRGMRALVQMDDEAAAGGVFDGLSVEIGGEPGDPE
jgi:hypothetical protein